MGSATWVKSSKREEAASLLRQIVEANPLEGKALILLGQHAWNEDNYTQASLFFERATRVKEWEVRALIEHARMSVANREYDDAVRMLEEAQTISPQPRVERYLKSIQNLLLSSRLKF